MLHPIMPASISFIPKDLDAHLTLNHVRLKRNKR